MECNDCAPGRLGANICQYDRLDATERLRWECVCAHPVLLSTVEGAEGVEAHRLCTGAGDRVYGAGGQPVGSHVQMAPGHKGGM